MHLHDIIAFQLLVSGIMILEGFANSDLKKLCDGDICDEAPVCPSKACNYVYPSKRDCATYYQFIQGKSYQFRCSPGLLFNEDALTCDYEYNVDCNLENSKEVVFTTGAKKTTVTTTPPKEPNSSTTEPGNTSIRYSKTTNYESRFPSNATSSTYQLRHSTITGQVNKSSFPSEITSTPVTKRRTKNTIISEEFSPTIEENKISTTTISSEDKFTLSSNATTSIKRTTANPTTVEKLPYTIKEINISITNSSEGKSIFSSVATTSMERMTTLQITSEKFPSTADDNGFTSDKPYVTKEKTSIDIETISSQSTYLPGNDTSSYDDQLSTVADRTINESTRATSIPIAITNVIVTSTSPTTDTDIEKTENPIKPEISTNELPFFECPSRFGLFPDPKSCSGFYQCSHWTPYQKTCPSNLHFNPIMNVCDNPYDAGCERRSTDVTFSSSDKSINNIETSSVSNRLPSTGSLLISTFELPKSTIASRSPTETMSTITASIENDPNNTIVDVTTDVNDDIKSKKTGIYENIDKTKLYFTTAIPAISTKSKEVTEVSTESGGTSSNKVNVISTITQETRDENKSVSESTYKNINKDTTTHIPGTTKILTSTIKSKTFTPDTETETTIDESTTSSNKILPTTNELSSSQKISSTIKTISTRNTNYPTIEDTTEPATTYFSNVSSPTEIAISDENVIYVSTESYVNTTERIKPSQINPDVADPTANSSETTIPRNDITYITNTPRPQISDLKSTTESRTYNDSTTNAQTDNITASSLSITAKKTDLPTITSKLFISTTFASTDNQTDGNSLIFECPSRFGLYPDLKNCSFFYHCSHYLAYRKSCPSNLHFNPKAKLCDWPEQAGCDNSSSITAAFENATRTTSSGITSTSLKNESNPSFVCPSSFGLFPVSDNCSRFYQCSYWLPYNKICPSSLHFNPKLQICDWPYKAGCVNSSSTAASTQYTTQTTLPETTIKILKNESLQVFICPSPFGLFPDTQNCSRFYHCSHWKPYRKMCPSNLHFNPVLEVCDWQFRAGCAAMLRRQAFATENKSPLKIW